MGYWETSFASVWWVHCFLFSFQSTNMRGNIDTFEIAILLCACFLVNYVTADAKVNWAEGNYTRDLVSI